jgi:hypothetical protein
MLENVTIIVADSHCADCNDKIVQLCACDGWATLDEALWNSALQKVHICIEYRDGGSPDDRKLLNNLMRLRLPRISQQGILSTGFVAMGGPKV